MIRLLAVLAAATLAAATPHGTPSHGRPTAAKRLAVVRTTVISGSGQRARAYVSPRASKYVAEFADPLVIAVSGPTAEDNDRVIIFRCITPGCTFLGTDQPDDGKFINRVGAVYKVMVVKGRAALRVTLQGDDATGTYRVRAEPSQRDGERGIPATFALTMR